MTTYYISYGVGNIEEIGKTEYIGSLQSAIRTAETGMADHWEQPVRISTADNKIVAFKPWVSDDEDESDEGYNYGTTYRTENGFYCEWD